MLILTTAELQIRLNKEIGNSLNTNTEIFVHFVLANL